MIASSETFQAACAGSGGIISAEFVAADDINAPGQIADNQGIPGFWLAIFLTQQQFDEAIDKLVAGKRYFIQNQDGDRWPTSGFATVVSVNSEQQFVAISIAGTVNGSDLLADVFSIGDTLTVYQAYSNALNHVHYYEADDDATVYPRAIVVSEPGYQTTRADNSNWMESGTVSVSIEVQPDGDTLDDKATDALNKIGGTVDDCLSMAGVETEPGESRTFVNLSSVELVAGPERCLSQNENGVEFWAAGYQFRYGDNG